MRRNKKSRPAGGTAETGRTTETAAGMTHDSYTDSNTKAKKPQAVFDLLPVGESNAISSRELAALMGVRTVRELQAMIAAEREDGGLILSTCRNGGGYYRPNPGAAGRAEISAYCHTLRSRALNTLRVLKTARAALGILDGQLDFLDFALQQSDD